MNAGAIENERTYARRLYADREKIIERDVRVVEQRGTYRFGMADDQDRPVTGIISKLLQMLHHPLLQLLHAFAVWRSAFSATAVPALPGGIVVQLIERARGPASEIDFIDLRNDLDGKFKMVSENRSGLPGAPPGTGLDGGWFRQDMPGANGHLAAPSLVELDARHAAAEHAVEQGMMSMTNQMDCLHHGYALASMKARVCKRASSSLNCCGGDFMK